MREIVLDTETTGLSPDDGHRIVEIGAVELLNHMPTGVTFHVYVNPERSMPEEAYAVHGLDEGFLRDKPRFADVAADFLDFAGDAPLVIHNAAFDMRFLNAELGKTGHPLLDAARAIDTVAIARRRFPGSPASLDALCRRFGVDNSAREKHGALLDAEILAEVYLELIGGRQPGLELSADLARGDSGDSGTWRPRPRPVPLASRLTDAEAAAHRRFVDALGSDAVWTRYDG